MVGRRIPENRLRAALSRALPLRFDTSWTIVDRATPHTRTLAAGPTAAGAVAPILRSAIPNDAVWKGVVPNDALPNGGDWHGAVAPIDVVTSRPGKPLVTLQYQAGASRTLVLHATPAAEPALVAGAFERLLTSDRWLRMKADTFIAGARADGVPDDDTVALDLAKPMLQVRALDEGAAQPGSARFRWIAFTLGLIAIGALAWRLARQIAQVTQFPHPTRSGAQPILMEHFQRWHPHDASRRRVIRPRARKPPDPRSLRRRARTRPPGMRAAFSRAGSTIRVRAPTCWRFRRSARRPRARRSIRSAGDRADRDRDLVMAAAAAWMWWARDAVSIELLFWEARGRLIRDAPPPGITLTFPSLVLDAVLVIGSARGAAIALGAVSLAGLFLLIGPRRSPGGCCRSCSIP